MGITKIIALAVLAVAQPEASAIAAAEPVVRHVAELGLVGELYVPPMVGTKRLPAIIELGGSEGGIGTGAAADAKALASHGYVVLQLAYFDAPGLQKELGLVPIEYFGTAIAWLGAQPGVDPGRIGIEGTSIGGEVALVVAAHYPQIKAVAAAVPSSVVWPGISHSNTAPPSTFTFEGKPLAYLPYGWNGPGTSVYELYAKGLEALNVHSDAVIPVERIHGPLMLICGGQDRIWPSCPMIDQIAGRWRTKLVPHRIVSLAYPEAGHAAFGLPGKITAETSAALGGTVAGNEAARVDSWCKMLAFMDAALSGSREPPKARTKSKPEAE